MDNKLAVIGASNERVSYEILVLASGGTPRKLPVEGNGLGQVFTLRGVDDAKKIDSGKRRCFHHATTTQQRLISVAFLQLCRKANVLS